MPDFSAFHSAVNRIPVLRAPSTRAASLGNLSQDLFADGPAPGHDHLEPERWSGSIDVEMTVRTPLVFGEQTVAEAPGGGGRGEGGHVVDLPLNADGSVHLPPTMVKGMISRAYETLTCSRFRVFGDVGNEGGFRRTADDRSVPLTYRGDAASALGLVPIRVCREDEDGLVGELFYGDTPGQEEYEEDRRVYPVMRAAALQSGPEGHARLVIGDVRRLEAMTPHGRQIRCRLALCLHGDRGRGARYAYWQVTHIYDGSEFVRVFEMKKSVTVVDEMDDVVGYVCRTAPDGVPAGQLFSRKHDERFFFDVSAGGPTEVRIGSEVRERYRAVVESYVLQRTKDSSRLGHRPNRATRSVQDAGDDAQAAARAASLTVGDLAFAVVETTDGAPTVREIVPTMIGRHAYHKSPRALAEEQGVLPVSRAGEASAADRLFGYVVSAAAEGATGGDVAARGRIVVGPVDGSQARVSTRHKKLSPLLSPKPSSARRFLTDLRGQTPREAEGGPLRRDRYFSDGQLLGTAAYPVHRRLLDDQADKDLDRDGFPAQATQAPSLGGQEQSNDAVRLTARSWIQVGSVLRCTLSFTNLSSDELGALVWVLTPENLVPQKETSTTPSARPPVGYLRMGLGKPFGLGALEVRIANGGLRAVRGDRLAERYTQLGGCLGQGMDSASPDDFPLPNEDTLRKTPWVRALQRAAFGYSDDIPVRHMSLDENKENNQTDSRSGEPKPHRGTAPTDLCCEDQPPLRMPCHGSGRRHSSRRGRA